MFEKVELFIAEDEQINQNSHEIIETGIRRPQKQHEKKLYELTKAKKDGETKAQEDRIKDMHRKQERRYTRQLRVKEQIKMVLKQEILKCIVDRGEAKGPSINFELMDLHGNYNQDKNVLTALGGHFQQLYYVVSSVFEVFGDDLSGFYQRRSANPTEDASKKALTARELMIEQFFLPFVVQYLRDTKCEGLSFMATPEFGAAMAEMKIVIGEKGHYDLAKLTKEQWIKFRYHFIENRMGNKLWNENKNDKAMELILGALALVLCKKVPTDIGAGNIATLHNKVKVLPPPEGEHKPAAAVLRLTPVTRPFTSNDADEDKIEGTNTIEIDQDSKAVAMNGRQPSLPYTVPVINQMAAKAVREDFVNQMVKMIPDFFKEESNPLK